MNPSNFKDYNEWILTTTPITIRKSISEVELECMRDTEIIFKDMLNNLIVEMKSYVTTEKLEPKVFEDKCKHALDIPNTWWDAFKDQYHDTWWFCWYCKLRPAKYYTLRFDHLLKVRVDPMILFPDDKHARQLGRHFRHVEYEKVVW